MSAIRDWGSTAAERAEALPCDALLPDHDLALHRAVDVAAPVGIVFRGLAWLLPAGDLVMMRKQLINLKALAEASRG